MLDGSSIHTFDGILLKFIDLY